MRLLFLFAILVSGCVSAPYYQKENANGIHRVGYSESKIDNNIYRVKYLDARDQYLKFLMRSSELTIQNGYKYFTIKDSANTKEGSVNVSTAPGVVADFALNEYEATIVMSNEKEKDSFDAKQILENNPIRK